jgi:asparaginyl-tRNA synthetase
MAKNMIRPGNYISDILSKPPGTPVVANGWVKTRRDGKNIHFIQLNDGFSPNDLQVVLEPGVVSAEIIARIATGACLSVEGELVASLGRGQNVELKAQKLILHGAADPNTYPLQKKKHNLDTLRDIGHLRPRSNTFSAVFRVRNRLAMAIHNFFQGLGFMYVHTPIISVLDAEGAGSLFQVTTLDLDKIAESGSPPDYGEDFFKCKSFLTVSGQLEAEIFAHAYPNVYTFGPTFRAEHSDTPRHLAEFYMIEPEMAFCDLSQNLALAEEFLKSLVKEVLTDCPKDLEFLTKYYDGELLTTLEALVDSKFEHVTYTDAVDLLRKADCRWDFPPEWGRDIQSEHERFLTERVFRGPVIVTDYPREIKAFYMRNNDDGKTVAAMDVLVPRIGEIIGGSQREERYDMLLSKIHELDDRHASDGKKGRRSAEEEYKWYLDLRRFGGVTHSGFGMGFERMMMYVTGMKNIRDVIPFPRTLRKAEL